MIFQTSNKMYLLDRYARSNQETCLDHRPSVIEGTWVQKGDLLADSAATVSGDVSLGKNLLVAYMPWEGYNFEDAILINERLVSEDLFSSLHIERYEVEARETKHGHERLTREIYETGRKPNSAENATGEKRKKRGENKSTPSMAGGSMARGSMATPGHREGGHQTPSKSKPHSASQGHTLTLAGNVGEKILNEENNSKSPKNSKNKNSVLFFDKSKNCKIIDSESLPRTSVLRLSTQDDCSTNKKREPTSKKLFLQLLLQNSQRKLKLSLDQVPCYPTFLKDQVRGYKHPYFQSLRFDQKFQQITNLVLDDFCRSFFFNRSFFLKRRLTTIDSIQKTNKKDPKKEEGFSHENFLMKDQVNKDSNWYFEPFQLPRQKSWVTFYKKKGSENFHTKKGFSLPPFLQKKQIEDKRKTSCKPFNLFYQKNFFYYTKKRKSKTLSYVKLMLVKRPSLFEARSFADLLVLFSTRKNRYAQSQYQGINQKPEQMKSKKQNQRDIQWIHKVNNSSEKKIRKKKSSIPESIPSIILSKKRLNKLPNIPEQYAVGVTSFKTNESSFSRRSETFRYRKEKMIQTVVETGIGSKDRVEHLDKNGIVKIGVWVKHRDILVGKVTPLPKRELSPHEKLFYTLLGRKPPTINETSLRVPKGVEGRVLGVETFSKESPSSTGQINPPESAQIYIAVKRKIQVGDKLAGRHGNKGIVSKILAKQDMPYLPDGTPVDIVLNPLGVPSRMNVGQVFECMLGLAGKFLRQQFQVTPFDELAGPEASRSLVYSKLFEASYKTGYKWLFSPDYPGKVKLFDGRTGEAYHQPITMGQAYILKLIHLVDDKIHARSVGPYSLITQQPVRGRSKHGGQRVGEMEVWAIEGFGAAYALQEILTIKSDDISGRSQVLNRILNDQQFSFGTPDVFRILIRELRALCLNISVNQPVLVH